MTLGCGVQVLMAIVARCCLHTMYEFTAFMNMWAVEALGVSGGVAAQVGAVSLPTLFTLILSAQRSVCLQHMLSSFLVLYHGPKAVAGHPWGGGADGITICHLESPCSTFWVICCGGVGR